eukprot:15366389-Ditylum_brightwellii.AAC.1
MACEAGSKENFCSHPTMDELLERQRIKALLSQLSRVRMTVTAAARNSFVLSVIDGLGTLAAALEERAQLVEEVLAGKYNVAHMVEPANEALQVFKIGTPGGEEEVDCMYPQCNLLCKQSNGEGPYVEEPADDDF